MKNYRICTDSACDITPKLLSEWDIPFCPLVFKFGDSDIEYKNSEMDSSEFYQKMRDGGAAKTSAVNSSAFTEMFENIIKGGEDILYLGFSSGLSTTYNSARLAAEALREKYPESKIITVDTLSASLGFGLLLYLTNEKKKAGADIFEAEEYAKRLIPKLCHWFTVEDLVYLKRGGRISAATAFVGNMLGIKPVMHMDNEGHLINMFKVRGRKTSISALADKYGELQDENENDTVFISHGDCEGEAESLADIIKSKYGKEVKLISNVGPVIGAHSGPGTIALFFIGKER